MADRAVYVVDAPLSERDRDRFGIDALVTEGFEVEVWAVDEIFQPRSDRLEPSAEGIRYRSLTTDAELAAAVDGLTDDDVVVAMCGMLVGQENQFARLRDLLLASQARVGAVSAGTRPPPLRGVASPGVGGRLVRAWNEVRAGRMSPAAAVRRASTLAAGALGGGGAPGRPRARSLDWAWTGPGVEVIDPSVLGAGTRVRALHTWDFDAELRDPVPRRARSGAVYLESMGPLHPDFPALGMKCHLTPTEWFSYVVQELSAIQPKIGEPITVAAHPRAEAGSLDAWYPGFQVGHGRTRELVANARLVLAAEPSTAIGLCAMYDTPALLLQPPRAFPDHLEDLAAYADALGLAFTSARDFPSEWEPAAALGSRREEFLATCIRNPEETVQPFWTSVVADIRDAGGASATSAASAGVRADVRARRPP